MSILIHPKTKRRLEKITTPGVYIVHGKRGSGRRTAVLAELVECDVEVIGGDGEPIKIEAVHQIARRLRLTKGEKNHAIVIDDAEMLSLAAQNALLKTLEELPGYATVVLITQSPEAVLPTVASRAESIYFMEPTRESVLDWIDSEFSEENAINAKKIVSLYGGLPARVSRFLAEHDTYDMSVIDSIEHLFSDDLNRRLRASVELQSQLPDVLDDIIMVVRKKLRESPSQYWSDTLLYCLDAERMLAMHANKRHILDVIALRRRVQWLN